MQACLEFVGNSTAWQPCCLCRMEELGLAALFLGPYGRAGSGSLVTWAVWKIWAWQPCLLVRMEELGLVALLLGPY